MPCTLRFHMVLSPGMVLDCCHGNARGNAARVDGITPGGRLDNKYKQGFGQEAGGASILGAQGGPTKN